MKKIFIILGIYTALFFGGCVAVSFIYSNLPELIPGTVGSYRFLRGLSWFLRCLPAILLTGFIAGCTSQWKVKSNANVSRFSPGIFNRFKHVFIVGLVIAAALTFSEEIFVPIVQEHQKKLADAPSELQKNISFAKKYQYEEKPLLAWQYARLAYNTAPNDAVAIRLLKETEDALERYRDSEGFSAIPVEHVSTPIKTADAGYTVKELLDKSDAEAAEGNWFNAHYWATLALEACSGTDTNRSRAQDAANLAWNNLSSPTGFNNEEEKNYFARKKEGYSALTNGDNLTAYYIFMELAASSAEHAEDPDVVRYLAVSRERVESDYFFIDETTDLRFMESAHNIYFTLPYPDNSRFVICINGQVSLEETGGYIRYLDGFYVAEYDSYGNFTSSLFVPFAKVAALPVSVLDQSTKEILGVQKNWRTVPYVQLQSVDRVTKGVVSKPEYSYTESGIPESVAKKFNIEANESKNTYYTRSTHLLGEPSYLILPMDYADFDILCEASAGEDSMSFNSVRKFISKAEHYGFAKEVYNQSFVKRITYPFYILILVIITAVFAWNYRITDEKSPFKFWWIFMFPLITLMMFVGLDVISYLFTLLNYVVVGLCGSFALPALCVIYVIILFVSSLLFLSRRAN